MEEGGGGRGAAAVFGRGGGLVRAGEYIGAGEYNGAGEYIGGSGIRREVSFA